MQWPSLTVVLSAVTAAYVAHSVWTLATLFYPTPCAEGAQCFTSYLRNDPPLQVMQSVYIICAVNGRTNHFELTEISSYLYMIIVKHYYSQNS